MVMKEVQDIIEQARIAAQSGAIDPVAAQQNIQDVERNMQDPVQLEKLISMQESKLMDELIPMLVPQGEDAMSDPLVQIRMQELDLKQKAEKD